MKSPRYLLSAIALFMALQLNAQQDTRFDQVFNLTQNDRHADAIMMLDEILKADPENARAYFIKGNSLIHMGKFPEAVASLEKATEVRTSYFEAYELLGNLYAQAKNADKAIENYEKAYEHDQEIENKLKYKIEIINILYLVRRHQYILAHIEDAKKLVPNNFDLTFLEAQYYNYIGDYMTAKGILDKLITEVPEREGNEMYFFEMGYTLHQMEEYEKAKTYFAKADGGEYRVKIREFTPEFYLQAAEIYFSVYEYERAEENMNIALKIDPSLTQAYELQSKLAAIKTPKSEIIKATEANAKVVEKDGNKPLEKYYELAVLYYQARDWQSAANYCDKILEEKNMDIQTHYLRAACEYQLKEQGPSGSFLGRMIKNPSLGTEIRARIFFMLGLVNKSTDNLEAAEECFQNSAVGPFKGVATRELESILKMYQKRDMNGK